jgi:hypothetical protein
MCITVAASESLRPPPLLWAVVRKIMWCTLFCLRKSSKTCFFCFPLTVPSGRRHFLANFNPMAIPMTSRPLVHGYRWQINSHGIYKGRSLPRRRPRTLELDMLIAKRHGLVCTVELLHGVDNISDTIEDVVFRHERYSPSCEASLTRRSNETITSCMYIGRYADVTDMGKHLHGEQDSGF